MNRKRERERERERALAISIKIPRVQSIRKTRKRFVENIIRYPG